MRYTLSIISLLILITISQSYAQEAGPTIQSTPNTITQYCSSGTCSTGGTQSIQSGYTTSTTHIPVLLVKLSKTCETLNKLNQTGCPKVSSIIKYDTSNQKISGKFITKNGITIREPPQVKNNWLYYTNSDKMIICVECTFDVTSSTQAKQIIIEPDYFTYIDKNAIVTKNLWSSYSNRYMQGCDVATIGNIPGLLNDTINYMLSNCTKTSFNTTSNHVIPDQPWSYDNPYSSLHQQAQVNKIKAIGGLGLCLQNQCNLQDPYRKAGW